MVVFFMKLVAFYIFLCETWCCWFLIVKLVECELHLPKTECILIYIVKKMLYFYFLFMFFSTLIFLFVSCTMIYLNRWNRLFLWNLLQADYCSWNLIYLDIFLREICCMLIYSFVKLIYHDIFLRETCCVLVFTFLKLNAC